jgi:hypothetical protein
MSAIGLFVRQGAAQTVWESPFSTTPSLAMNPVILFVAAAGIVIVVSLVLTLSLGEAKRADRRRGCVHTVGATWAAEPTLIRLLRASHLHSHGVLRQAAPELLVLSQVPLAQFVRMPHRTLARFQWTQESTPCADFVLCSDNGVVLAVVDLMGGPGLEHRALQKRAVARRQALRTLLSEMGVPLLTWAVRSEPEVQALRKHLRSLNVIGVDAPKPELVDICLPA